MSYGNIVGQVDMPHAALLMISGRTWACQNGRKGCPSIKQLIEFSAPGFHFAVDSFVAAKRLRDPHPSTENHSNTRIRLEHKYLIVRNFYPKSITALGTGGPVIVFRYLRGRSPVQKAGDRPRKRFVGLSLGR